MVFDNAYVDLFHLAELDMREANRVSRAKDNMLYRVKRNLTKGKENIIKDQLIVLTGKKHAGMEVRRVEAWVEVNGAWRVMVFLNRRNGRPAE